MTMRLRKGEFKPLRSEVMLYWLFMVTVFFCNHVTCSAQVQTLSFINKSDSLKVWGCQLPVEATIQTNDKRKIQCLIVEADDLGFVALDIVTDPLVQQTSNWKKAFSEMYYEWAVIESDPALSHEAKRAVKLQKSIGVLYRDTIRPLIDGIKKVTFPYNSHSQMRKAIPMVAYGVAGIAVMAGMVELMVSSDPEVEGTMQAPYPAVLLLTGLAGVTASGIWIFHSYHKVIRTKVWRLQGTLPQGHANPRLRH